MQVDDTGVVPIAIKKRRKLIRIQCSKLLESGDQFFANLVGESAFNNGHAVANQILRTCPHFCGRGG